MSAYSELLAEDLERQLEFTNVKTYHDAGYTGKGITILNTEDGDEDHGQMTNGCILDYAPNVTIINSWIRQRIKSNEFVTMPYIEVDGEYYDLDDAIDLFNIKLITTSYAGSEPTVLLDYFKTLQEEKGVIMFCAAGNEDDEAGLYSADDTATTVSASKLYEDGTVKIRYYGELGEIDFSFFMGSGTGTSAASPSLTGFTALLLDRYGDMTQDEMREVLKSISLDYGDTGYDDYYGDGIPILPLTDTLEKLEELRGDDEVLEEVEVVEETVEDEETDTSVDFTDVEETDWFYEVVNECAEAGLVNGYEDGTFKPLNNPTRAELCAFGSNILKLIKG
jgi:subtilisin family serine protease